MSTIAAISTPGGAGGIAVIRLSGPDAFTIADRVWKGKPLAEAASHTVHLGRIISNSGDVLDHAVAAIFRAPNSFTGENTVEFSVHGSKWIQQAVLRRLVEAGATPAGPGEFTQQAFLNGKLDLAQAEGVADLIAASSRAAHKLAMSQVNGGFSRKIGQLRERLVELSSLLELELDFSEEDVEFADRGKLLALYDESLQLIDRLLSTFESGRAFKEGVPVAIAGRPNAGKSTLLNQLLGEEKAIVSDIPGTTRDVIEDTCEINGVLFRFYDTAGLRDTTDTIEQMGIDRARNAISRAAITLWIIDSSISAEDVNQQILDAKMQYDAQSESKNIIVFNKIDAISNTTFKEDDDEFKERKDEFKEDGFKEGDEFKEAGDGFKEARDESIMISAKTGYNIDKLKSILVRMSKTDHDPDAEIIITNARHAAALQSGAEAIRRAKQATEDRLPADLIAQDLREALHHLGTLTGQVTTDHLLTTIFTRFCIGK